MNIIIDGIDFTSIFSGCLIKPFHEKVRGPNAGTSMGGTEILDTIKVRNGFETTIGLMSQTQYTSIISLIKEDYLTVSYDDPDTGESVTREMILSAGSVTQIPLLSGGYAYKNMAVTFRER